MQSSRFLSVVQTETDVQQRGQSEGVAGSVEKQGPGSTPYSGKTEGPRPREGKTPAPGPTAVGRSRPQVS